MHGVAIQHDEFAQLLENPGKHRSGFAVVADEVCTLANGTQKSREEIQHMIEQLQSGSRQAVKVMHHSNEQTQETASQGGKA